MTMSDSTSNTNTTGTGSSSTNNNVLIGHVYFHCQLKNERYPILVPSSSTDIDNTKDSTDIKTTKKRKLMPSSSLSTSTPQSSPSNTPFVGWIFEFDEDDYNNRMDDGSTLLNDTTKNYALLCIPQCYEVLVCNACRYQHKIQVTHYTTVALTINNASGHLPHNITTMICIPNLPDRSIEIVNIPLSMKEIRYCYSQHNNKKDDNIWTLPEVAKYETSRHILESIEEQQMSSNERHNILPKDVKKQHKTTYYSFIGMVKTVSPILSVNGQDPFVLVELINHDTVEILNKQQHNNDDSDDNDEICMIDFSCILVIRKLGLVCHTSIVPNECIIVHHVRQQQWRIPDVMTKQHHNYIINTTTIDIPPSSVFVIDSIDQIEFIDMNRFTTPTETGMSFEHYINGTTIITGNIVNVHFLSKENEKYKYIDYVEIKLLSQPLTIILHTTEYPMSTSLYLCLYLFSLFKNQTPYHISDAELQVQVSNVQCLGYHGYGATLYTHFAVLEFCCYSTTTTTNFLTSSINQNYNPKQIPVNNLELSFFPIPYDIVNVQYPYTKVWMNQLVYSAIHPTFTHNNDQHSPLPLHVYTQYFYNIIHKHPSIASSIKLQNKSALINNCPTTSSKRNVYIEYFTRPKMKNMNPIIQLPLPVRVSYIQQRSFKVFAKHLQFYIEKYPNNMKIGWTSSKQLIGKSMYKLFVPKDYGFDHYDSNQESVYTLGHCCIEIQNGIPFASVSDSTVTLPIVFNENVSSSILEEYCQNPDTTIAWVGIQAVIISCICIGTISPSPDSSTDIDYSHQLAVLPTYTKSTGIECSKLNSPTFGSCGICVVNGFLFMLSVHLIAEQYHTTDSESSSGNAISKSVPSSESAPTLISLEQCLNPTLWTDQDQKWKNSKVSVVGLLTRLSYKLGKVKSNAYSHCTMTLAHTSANMSDGTLQVPSTMQSVEIKPPILLDPYNWNELKYHIQPLLGVNNPPIPEERLTLCIVWWNIADCPWTCSLLGGGWDDLVDERIESQEGGELHKKVGVIVNFPYASLHRDSKRGYTRTRCKLDNMIATCRVFNDSSRIHRDEDIEWFDVIGKSDKFLQGMLDRRPKRRRFGELAFGEIITHPGCTITNPNNIVGIPQCRLSDLMVLLCRDLQSKSARYHLAPSLTREIRNATFLGISYCRAKAECSLCYESLYNPESDSDSSTASRANEQHRIKPLYDSIKTSLQCPNGCNVDVHASIKWECSGTIDDGTAQAKLYAEREAAICLLGLSSKHLQCIEDAIWESNRTDGYVYIKTSPPSSYLRSSIIQARSMAIQNIQQSGKDIRNINNFDVIQYLSKSNYAEYIFHYHCRTSYEPIRPLIYFVRCKPLYDTVETLNQSEIDIITTNPTTSSHATEMPMNVVPTKTTTVQTYTLPRLNLNLVDCCIPISGNL